MQYAFLVFKVTFHDDGNMEIREPNWVSLSRAKAFELAARLEGGVVKDSCGYPYYEVEKFPLSE